MTVIPGPAQPARVRRRAIHPVSAVLAASLLVGAPATLGAQQTGLSKSELVRLVVSSAPDDEKVSTIGSRCLSFEPTASDWADLRGLGASEAMISAAQQCARTPEIDQTVTVGLSASRITARAGETTGVTVILTRAGSPLPGVTVTVSGAGGAGEGFRQAGPTDDRGRAYFPLPSGTLPGTARYTVSAVGTALDGPTRVTVTTVAGIPYTAAVDPPTLALRVGERVPDVRVEVRDRFGNAVPAADLELTSGSGDDAVVLAAGAADNTGAATLVPASDSLGAGTASWEVRSGDVVLATLPVTIDAITRPPPAVAPTAPADAAVRAGEASLAEGDLVAAETSFREALRLSPRRRDAQKGLAAALLAQGKADEAITWYELATRQNAADAEAWAGLGQSYAAAGRRDDAADALERARELDPTREELDTEIADLGRPPGHASGYAWGGSTQDSGESGGLRRAALDVSFSAVVRVWGGWDRSLAPRSPELIRGPDEWDTWYAGGGYSWGSGDRLETAFELGQRKQRFGEVAEDANLTQNVFRLTQFVRFSDDPRGTTLAVGAFLGRWFDRDDWIAFSRLKAPVGRELSVLGSLSYGRNIGTNWIETGRHADKDGRAYLGLAWETEKGFAVQPLVGVGSVSSDRSDELSGTLVDLLLEGAVPIGRSAGIRLFVRHQRPPGSEPFTVIAAGLGFKVGWAGG